MIRASRVAAPVAGVLALAAALWATHRLAGSDGFVRYGFRYLIHLGPGEAAWLLTWLAGAGAGGLLVTWGIAPVVAAAVRGRIVPDRFVAWGLPILAVLGTGLVAGLALRGAVVTDDEYVYLFQSRILAEGRAALPPPPFPEFWTNAFVTVRDGRWFGQYPPGHPLLLLPGVAAGFPRLVPLLAAGLSALLTLSVFRRVAGAWGAAAALLIAVSPLFVLTGATLLSHSTAYLALALAAWGLVELDARDRARAGWALGAGLGLLVLARPWTGVTLGGVVGAAALLTAHRSRRKAFLLPMFGIGLAMAAFFLWYNHGATGHALTTGYSAIRGAGRIEFGFGTVVPGEPPHTPATGLLNVLRLALRFSVWAWGAPLLWAFAFLPGGSARGGAGASLEGRAYRLAWIALAVGLLGYIPYWSIGVADTGPVKTYELLLPAGMLVAIGLARASRRRGPGFALAGVIVALAISGGFFWPGRVAHVAAVAGRVRLPYREVARTVEPPAVVFTANTQPAAPWSWVFGRPNPSPGLDDPILYVRDGGAADATFLRGFPGRRAYRLEFDGTVPVVRPLFRTAP